MSELFSSYVWWNGNCLPAKDVRISPFDHGLLVGNGVFETLIAYNGAIFEFSKHYERLQFSAQPFGFKLPTEGELLVAAKLVLQKNNFTELDKTRIRITVTGGEASLGSDRGKNQETILVAAMPAPDLGESVSVLTVPWIRSENAPTTGLKTISYADNVLALAWAKQRGGGEAIFLNAKNQLNEGTGSNVFLVDPAGGVVTPPLEAGCLNGVTRRLVIELCRNNNIPISEKNITVDELSACEEAFLTSTTREVQPIIRIDGRELPPPSSKSTTHLLYTLFQEYKNQVNTIAQ